MHFLRFMVGRASRLKVEEIFWQIYGKLVQSVLPYYRKNANAR